ncbi:MAG: hypothetical protein ACRDRZ_13110 [Pseudonocardiaceae bacterium]
MSARSQARRARRAAFHGRRCANRTGIKRLDAAWSWLLGELSDAVLGERDERAIEDVADHLTRVARELNHRKGARP